MNPDEILRDKLRKIEALFAGAATPGEKAAAGAAAERLRQRLGEAGGKEQPIELKFSIPEVWSRQLFIALCRRYGLRPYRHARMHRQSIMLKAPKKLHGASTVAGISGTEFCVDRLSFRDHRKGYSRGSAPRDWRC